MFIAGQPSHTNEQYPPSTESYNTPVGYRHVLSLQTGQLPPPQEYQVSPFTPSYNFDSFYQQYAHENSSTVSLPASYMRSSQQSTYEPASGTYSYENQDMSHRLAASQPGGTRWYDRWHCIRAIAAITVYSNFIFWLHTNGIHLWILYQKPWDFFRTYGPYACNIIHILHINRGNSTYS